MFFKFIARLREPLSKVYVKSGKSIIQFGKLIIGILFSLNFISANSYAESLYRYDTDTSVSMTKIRSAYGRVPTFNSNLLHRWVVAGRDSNNNLRIEGYKFTDSSRQNINHEWVAAAGSVSQVALTWVGSNGLQHEDSRFVTAVRDSYGKLRLILWQYNNNKRLDTAGYLPSIKNKQISIASLYNGYLVTAAQENDNDIRLDLWRVTNSNHIVHRASAIAGNGSWANVVHGFEGKVVAAFRNGDGRLSTQMFNINSGYDQLNWDSGWVSSLAGKVQARSWNERYMVAAFETSSDTLGVYFYDMQNAIHWHAGNIQSGYSTGKMSEFSLGQRGKLSTIVKDESGNAKLIRWNFENNGVVRETDNEVSGYPMGQASHLSVEGGSGAGGDLSTHNQLLAAVRDSLGLLRLVVFHSY